MADSNNRKKYESNSVNHKNDENMVFAFLLALLIVIAFAVFLHSIIIYQAYYILMAAYTNVMIRVNCVRFNMATADADNLILRQVGHNSDFRSILTFKYFPRVSSSKPLITACRGC